MNGERKEEDQSAACCAKTGTKGSNYSSCVDSSSIFCRCINSSYSRLRRARNSSSAVSSGHARTAPPRPSSTTTILRPLALPASTKLININKIQINNPRRKTTHSNSHSPPALVPAATASHASGWSYPFSRPFLMRLLPSSDRNNEECQHYSLLITIVQIVICVRTSLSCKAARALPRQSGGRRSSKAAKGTPPCITAWPFRTAATTTSTKSTACSTRSTPAWPATSSSLQRTGS